MLIKYHFDVLPGILFIVLEQFCYCVINVVTIHDNFLISHYVCMLGMWFAIQCTLNFYCTRWVVAKKRIASFHINNSIFVVFVQFDVIGCVQIFVYICVYSILVCCTRSKYNIPFMTKWYINFNCRLHIKQLGIRNIYT
jgi:hypothetical protein